ncbi:MAG: ATP-dependent Clp protease ATP-binding subunit [Candidatus Paceibacterota bacterium]
MGKIVVKAESRYLGLNTTSRFIVRLIRWMSYSALITLVVVFTLSSLTGLNAVALMLALFLLDELCHMHKSKKNLARLKREGEEVNAADYLSPRAIRLLSRAQTRARISSTNLNLQVLNVLLTQADTKRAFERLEVKSDRLAAKLQEYLQKSSSKKVRHDKLHTQRDQLIKTGFERAQNHFDASIGNKDVLAALGYIKDFELDQLYSLFEINAHDVELASILSVKKKNPKRHFFARRYKVKEKRMNRSWTARPTPTLDQISTDLTDVVRAHGEGLLIGHVNEYDRLTDLLAKGRGANVLLVGEPGVGKTSLVKHLALQINSDRVPHELFDKRLVQLDTAALINTGEHSKEYMQKLLNEIKQAGNIILYIPQISTLNKAQGSMSLTLADSLLPELKESSFALIASSYPKEFKSQLEENSQFKEAFSVINVEEMSEEEASHYLSYQSLILEQESPITISLKALRKAVSLAKRYFRQKMLPESALALLKETLADVQEKGREELFEEDVVNTAQKQVNVPLKKAKEKEAQSLVALEDTIHESYIDQEQAVKAVADALRQYRAGIANTKGPIASFLFIGPTGVGKTELSKILTKIQFGSEGAMKRFDMSEYQTKESTYRLIGSPDGAVQGALTEAVRLSPYALILLDEFEKAHPDILNLFLQVLDDARLTDNLGRTIDFSNTIIIATSNAHSDLIKQSLEAGQGIEQVEASVKGRLTEYFKPELINRFSKIVTFKPLSKEDTKKILNLELGRLAEQLKNEHTISLTVSEGAMTVLVEKGFDPVYGARPLKNTISEEVKNVVATMMLKGELKPGQILAVDAENGVLTFS